jgi:hypothetical protein
VKTDIRIYVKEGVAGLTGLSPAFFTNDLNKNSAYAFSYAVDMAKGHDAKIVILHAIELIRATKK